VSEAHGIDVAVFDAALREVLTDLRGRPLNAVLVIAYWLVMTSMLLERYEASEDGLTGLYPAARALRVEVRPADARVMN
jgi:hypothetical protein